MKNSKELKEMRGDKIAELEAIRDIATAEGRDLSEAENQEVDTLLGGVESLDGKIKRADKIEANLRTSAMNAGTPIGTKAPKEYKQWSLFKAIKDFQNHNLIFLYRSLFVIKNNKLLLPNLLDLLFFDTS